jgi:hypothetical protein
MENMQDILVQNNNESEAFKNEVNVEMQMLQ